jgi:glycine/D-amino acid oxidase-like deaminating enzyme
MTYFLQIPLPTEALQLTEALAQAVAEAAKLPVEDQNYIAFRIMEEVAEEKKWADSFARSPELLDRLAEEAREEIRQGRTQPLEDIL